MGRSTDLRKGFDKQVDQEKIAHCAHVLSVFIVGSWLPGLGCVYLAWGDGRQAFMLWWLGLFLVHIAYQLYRHRRYKQFPSKLNYQREKFAQIAACLITGNLGGWSLILFGEIGLQHTFLVYCLIFSFYGLGVMVAGFNPVAYSAFVVASLAPLEVELLIRGTEFATIIALMIVVAAVVLFVTVRRSCLVINNWISLRNENQIIASELEAKNELLKQANKGKSILISAASHDLRQPVYGMTLMINKIRERCRIHNAKLCDLCPAMEAEREFSEIENALQYLARSISNLLDLSRLDAGAISVEKKSVNVSELFSRLAYEFSPQATTKNIELRLRDPGLFVVADENLLYSLLSNLVANAISYSDKGCILLAARRRGLNCRIYVMDQGIGINPTVLVSGQIFQEYFRASALRQRSPGVGLGLAIADRFARSMGTVIDVASIEGRGSTFSIELPRSSPSNAPAMAIMLPGGAATRGFDGVQAMLVTVSLEETDWIFTLLEANNAVMSCCSTMMEAYMWAKKVHTGILILDLPELRSAAHEKDWMFVSQIASISDTLQIAVLVDHSSLTDLSPHPFGIETCRMIERSTSPLKLKSILLRECHRRTLRPISASPNTQNSKAST